MVEALGTNVVLEIVERNEELEQRMAKSGLHLPKGKAQGQPDRGTVVSIGPAVGVEVKLSIGDVVIFQKAGVFQGFKDEDKDLVAVDIQEIKCKVKDA